MRRTPSSRGRWPPRRRATLRRLPRLALDAELVEKLGQWAEEFDALDDDRYTAADFIEWVRLERQPRLRATHG